MAPGPSVVFTEFGSRTDPMLRGWIDFRAQVLTGAAALGTRSLTETARETARAKKPTATVSGAQSGIWRLVASNHREVARSLFLYESLAQATEHVSALQNEQGELIVRLVKGPKAGQHGWLAASGDGAVISCGRWYSASSLSREAAEFSLTALRTASLPSASRGAGAAARGAVSELRDARTATRDAFGRSGAGSLSAR